MKTIKDIEGFTANLTFPIPTAPYYLNSLPQLYNQLAGAGSHNLLPNCGFDNTALFNNSGDQQKKNSKLLDNIESGNLNVIADVISDNFYTHQKLNDVYNVVFIIGCGGTGGYLVRDLGRYVSTLPYGDKCLLVLIDGDKVEHKNLNRQNFIKQDLSKNKAEVMAHRYATHYGVNMVAYPQHITKDNISDLMGNVALSKLISTYFLKGASATDTNLVNLCVISCVDNNATRRLLHRYFADSNQWNIDSHELAGNNATPYIRVSSVSWIDSGNMAYSGQVVAYYNTLFTPGMLGLYGANLNRGMLLANSNNRNVMGLPHSSARYSDKEVFDFILNTYGPQTIKKLYAKNDTELSKESYIKIANPLLSAITVKLDKDYSVTKKDLVKMNSLLSSIGDNKVYSATQLYTLLSSYINNAKEEDLPILRAYLLSYFASPITKQNMLGNSIANIFPICYRPVIPDKVSTNDDDNCDYSSYDDLKLGVAANAVSYYLQHQKNLANPDNVSEDVQTELFGFSPTNLPEVYSQETIHKMYKDLFAIDHKWEVRNQGEASVKLAYLYNIFQYLGGIITFPVTEFYPDILTDKDERTNLELSCAEQAMKDGQTISVNIHAASECLKFFAQIFAGTPSGSFLKSYGTAWNNSSANEIPINFKSISRVLSNHISEVKKEEVA